MVHLFLLGPNWKEYFGGEDDDISKRMTSLLHHLESVIWSSMTAGGGRSEARLWLCNAISSISSLTSRQQQDLFLSLLRRSPTERSLASQLLQMVFQKQPHKLGHVIAKRSYVLQNFFQGNPVHIMQWFSNFSYSGGSEHKKGAKALSQFAFVNRDICWGELEWKGKHGQSPAVVATKPHYFLDLDVQRTVENFIDNVPEFWSSSEFAESLKDGDILFIDTKFFINFFVNLMYKEDSRDVWEVINEFLLEESFSSLCQHLLIMLEEHEFTTVLELLHKYLNPRTQSNGFGNSSNWLEFLLSKCSCFKSIDDLLLLSAVINQGRQLLQIIHDEELYEEKEKIEDIVSQIWFITDHANSLVPLLNECSKVKTMEAIKFLALQSWALHYALSKECQTPESWQCLFSNNGIKFRKSDKYGLLQRDGSSEDNDSELDSRASGKRKCHKKKRRKRNINKHDNYDHEPLDFDTSDKALQAGNASWLLSTDGFSAPWSNTDLPEHLSKMCFSTWMKWAFSK